MQAVYGSAAPDQRGYNTSDKPKGLRAYGMDRVVEDVVGLIDEAGRERAYVVAHDWGGMTAWWLRMKQPDGSSAWPFSTTRIPT